MNGQQRRSRRLFVRDEPIRDRNRETEQPPPIANSPTNVFIDPDVSSLSSAGRRLRMAGRRSKLNSGGGDVVVHSSVVAAPRIVRHRARAGATETSTSTKNSATPTVIRQRAGASRSR